MFYFFLYMLVGLVAGTLSGLLGIGGGLIVIPSIVFLLKLQGLPNIFIMHLAAGTSLAVMVFTTSASLYGHLRHGVQVWPIYRQLLPGIICGTIFGALFARILPSTMLEILFGLFILFVAIKMLFGLKPKPSRRLLGKKGMFTVAFLIGTKSGMLGLGGGTVTIPFLSYCNVAIRNTVAISAACSVTIAILGTISFIITGSTVTHLPPWSFGYIYLPAFLGIAIVSPFAARLGAYLSHKLPIAVLVKILAVVLLIMAARMLW